MRVLLSPNDSLTAVMSGAAATTNPYYHVTVGDAAGGSLTQTSGSLSGATAVTLASAPTAGTAVTTDVTTLYVTNVASTDLEIRVLLDATP